MLVVVAGLGNIRHTLIQRTLDDSFRSTVLVMSRGKSQLQRVVFQEFPDSVRHLKWI